MPSATPLEIPAAFKADCRRGRSVAEMARDYGRSLSTVSKWRTIVLAQNPIGLPPAEGRDYVAEIPQLEGDWAVCSDGHLPYYDADLMTRMVRISEQRKVRKLAVVGDLFDVKWLSMYDIKDLAGSLRDDLAVGIKTLRVLLSYYDEIVWLMGNHEERLFRSLKYQLNLPDLVQFLVQDGRVKGYNQPRAILHSGGKEWRLTHPKSYSRNATTVAATLCEKYHQNVLSAHGHFIGWKFSASGQYIGGDLGGLFDVRRQEYLHLGGDTTHPCWCAGFWLVVNGYPYVYSNHMTDWDKAA